jgi:hypothetical protein
MWHTTIHMLPPHLDTFPRVFSFRLRCVLSLIAGGGVTLHPLLTHFLQESEPRVAPGFPEQSFKSWWGFSGISRDLGADLGGSKILCDLGTWEGFFSGFRGNLMGCVIFQCTQTHGNKSLCPQGTIDMFMQCFETCFGFIRGTQYVTIVPHCNPDFSGLNILWLTMGRDCN